jgi:hypothetical protein
MANNTPQGADQAPPAIADVQRFGVAHRLEDKHHKQLAMMRERLAVLVKADRAVRPRGGGGHENCRSKAS